MWPLRNTTLWVVAWEKQPERIGVITLWVVVGLEILWAGCFARGFSWQRGSSLACIPDLVVKQTPLTAFGRHGHYATDHLGSVRPTHIL